MTNRFTAHNQIRPAVFDNLKKWTVDFCDTFEEAQAKADEMNRLEERARQDNAVLVRPSTKGERVGAIRI